MKRLPVQIANELSNLINQMLIGREALARAQQRHDPGDIQYWHDYLLNAERELMEAGIHLAAPLE